MKELSLTEMETISGGFQGNGSERSDDLGARLNCTGNINGVSDKFLQRFLDTVSDGYFDMDVPEIAQPRGAGGSNTNGFGLHGFIGAGRDHGHLGPTPSKYPTIAQDQNHASLKSQMDSARSPQPISWKTNYLNRR